MTSATVARKSLSPHIGIEIEGVDLSRPLDEQTQQEIRQAWIESGLLLFRGALHSNEDHLRLSEVFGQMEPSATADLNSSENPYLMNLRQTPHNAKARRYLINGVEKVGFIGWHWDQAFMPRIVRGAVLRMIEPSASGGETGFIDAIGAYDRLTDEMKARIDNLEVVYEFDPAMEHNPGYPKDIVPMHAASVVRRADGFPPVVHPLVITQPETGRKALKLSPTHVRYILGMDRAESDALIAELADSLTSEKYAYYHEWSANDVVVWDNWRVIHSASGVPDDASRLAIRTTIAGDYQGGKYLDSSLDPDNPPRRFDD